MFIEINSESNLQKLLKLLPYSIPIFVLGAGSNVIIRDGGFNGITIKLNGNLKQIHFDKKKFSLLEEQQKIQLFQNFVNKILSLDLNF